MKKFKDPTSTSLVERALRECDDFRTMAQLRDLLKLDTNHTSAALSHLKKYGAADCMEVDGTLWWYATPDSDRRIRTVEERCPETGPRKPRKPRKRKEVDILS